MESTESSTCIVSSRSDDRDDDGIDYIPCSIDGSITSSMEPAIALNGHQENGMPRTCVSEVVKSKRKNCGIYQVLEVLILAAILALILILYMVPTILFVHPPVPFQLLQNPPAEFANCSSKSPYYGQVCRQELSSLSGTCSSNTSLEVTQHEEGLESNLGVLLNAVFPTINPSPECNLAFRSFLCLYTFGVCDSNSSALATKAACSNVKDGVCKIEWRNISNRNLFSLPNCQDLPSTEDLPFLSDPSTVTNASVPPSCEAVNDTQFNCSDSFYFDTSLGLCRLSCGFSPHKNILSREGLRSIGIFATVMLLLFSVINLLSALTFQRKVMFKYPTIYFFFYNIDTLIHGIIIAVSTFLDRSFLCEDQDYLRNLILNSGYVYCTTTGIFTVYTMIQIGYLLSSYSVAVFWGTYFPFNYRAAKAIGRVKYVLIITLVVSFSVPLLSLVLLKDGYFTSNFLLSSCTNRNPTDYYIVLTLQLSLLLFFMSSLWILIIWKIFKDMILNKREGKKRCGAAEFAEVKLVTILVYHILAVVIVLGVQSFTTTLTPPLYVGALLPYIACESTGGGATMDCENLLSQVQRPHLFNLSVVYIILLSLAPLVLFLFSTDFKLYIKILKKTYKKLSQEG